MGVPYAYGGTTKNGVDCSALVQNIYAENNITIPRTSQAQYKATANSRISNITDLQYGDLVFFKGSQGTNTEPGHVGIYVGNGEYVHAPKTGDVVKKSKLADRSDFMGGGRIDGVYRQVNGALYDAVGTLTGSKNNGIDGNLSLLGKIISFIVLLLLGVLGVVFFTKAFNIPTSKADLIKTALDSKKPETKEEPGIIENTTEKGMQVVESIDNDISYLIDEVL